MTPYDTSRGRETMRRTICGLLLLIESCLVIAGCSPSAPSSLSLHTSPAPMAHPETVLQPDVRRVEYVPRGTFVPIRRGGLSGPPRHYGGIRPPPHPARLRCSSKILPVSSAVAACRPGAPPRQRGWALGTLVRRPRCVTAITRRTTKGSPTQTRVDARASLPYPISWLEAGATVVVIGH
jgi:hypothetical protein